MCRLCYQHDDVPESAKIADCYKPETSFEYLRTTMRVYKGTYQSRLVAVHVLRSHLTERDGWRKVGSIVIFDPTGDFF